MLSGYLSAILQFGVKVYEYFKPPTPDAAGLAVEDWTSVCAHWVGVLVGPVILVLIFKRCYSIFEMRRALNGEPVPPAGEGSMTPEEPKVPLEAGVAAPQAGGDADVAAEQHVDHVEEVGSGDA